MYCQIGEFCKTFKIKKRNDVVKINTIKSIEDNYEIKLSTKNEQNLNFVLCEQKKYSMFYARLLSHFAYGGTLIELDLQDEKRYDTKLMFVYENLDYRDLLDYFLDMRQTSDFEEISNNANIIFNKLLGQNDDFLKIDNHQIMIPDSLSADEATIAYYALLAAIRKKYMINYPLIIEGFGRWGLNYAPLLAHLVYEFTPQALIFTTENIFATTMNVHAQGIVNPIFEKIRNAIGSIYKMNNGKMTAYTPV